MKNEMLASRRNGLKKMMILLARLYLYVIAASYLLMTACAAGLLVSAVVGVFMKIGRVIVIQRILYASLLVGISCILRNIAGPVVARWLNKYGPKRIVRRTEYANTKNNNQAPASGIISFNPWTDEWYGVGPWWKKW